MGMEDWSSDTLVPVACPSGLLIRCGRTWHFTDFTGGDVPLALAVAWPLSDELPDEVQDVFDRCDQWRSRHHGIFTLRSAIRFRNPKDYESSVSPSRVTAAAPTAVAEGVQLSTARI